MRAFSMEQSVKIQRLWLRSTDHDVSVLLLGRVNAFRLSHYKNFLYGENKQIQLFK
jgi:hypothetical protein